jgi:hypothetical protein
VLIAENETNGINETYGTNDSHKSHLTHKSHEIDLRKRFSHRISLFGYDNECRSVDGEQQRFRLRVHQTAMVLPKTET